jgi:hypothetical protein
MANALRDACKVALGANLLLALGCARLLWLDVLPNAAANLLILSLAAGALCAVGAWGRNTTEKENDHG